MAVSFPVAVNAVAIVKSTQIIKQAVIINVAKGIHLRKVEKNISQAKNSLKLLFVFKLNFLSKFLNYICYLSMCGGQRTTCRSQLSPSTM